VILLSQARPDSRLSVLKSFSSLLVLIRVFLIRVLTVFVDNLVSKVLKFLVGKLLSGFNIFLVTHLLL